MDNPSCSFSILKQKDDENTPQAPSISEKDLSKDQKVVFDAMMSFIKNKSSKLLTVGGFAGSGKTTVLSCFAKKITCSVAYCAFTGKAACVLRNKLKEQGVIPEYCGTIHSLIYVPIINFKTKKILGWKKRSTLEFDLIVVDEGSMVSQKIWNDLKSYNKQILVVGDHGQLPPINSFMNLMQNPMVKLDKIHRQAENNPIIKLSKMIREGKSISSFPSNDKVIISSSNAIVNSFIEKAYLSPKANPLDSVIITYYNSSRIRFNNLIRKKLSFGDEIENNDVLICLKNVYYDDGAIFNGMRGTVDVVNGLFNDVYDLKIDFPYEELSIEGEISAHQLNKPTFASLDDVQEVAPHLSHWKDVGLLFDYGYALTCHKSQASGFQNVLVCVEHNSKISEDEFRRWKYTAVTRSSDNLVIIL